MVLHLLFQSALVWAAVLPASPVDASWWRQRHDSYVRDAEGLRDVRLLFLGDSITDLWRNEGAKVWKAQIAPLRAVNFGIGGDRVENLLWRVTHGETGKLAPEAVILLIGTNNVPVHSVTDTLDTYAELTRAIRERLPKAKLLLLALLPRNDRWSDQTRQNIPAINTGIAKLRDEENIFFFDMTDRFLETGTPGTPSKELFHDGLHLTERGYALWWREMRPVLEKLVGHPL